MEQFVQQCTTRQAGGLLTRHTYHGFIHAWQYQGEGEDSSGSGGGLQELGSLEYIIQSWAHDIFIASRQRQRDNVIDPQGPEKILKGLGVEQSQKQIL